MKRQIVFVLLGMVLMMFALASVSFGSETPCDETPYCISWRYDSTEGKWVCANLEEPSGDYGCKIGEFMGVVAYSNGNRTGSDYGDLRYQCVGYVKAFYNEVFGIDLPSIGVAKNYYTCFDDNPLWDEETREAQEVRKDDLIGKGFVRTPNNYLGSLMSGDILVFDNGGNFGHVAIVKWVTEREVYFIEQNWPNNGSANRSLPIQIQDCHHKIDDSSTSYKVLGWLHSSQAKFPVRVVKFPDSPECYLVCNNQLWWIQDEEIFRLLGYTTEQCGIDLDFSQVEVVDSTTLPIRAEALLAAYNRDGYKVVYRVVDIVGPNVCFHRTVPENAIFLFGTDNKFHHIADEETYLALGYKNDWSDVVDISQDLFDAYGEGDCVGMVLGHYEFIVGCRADDATFNAAGSGSGGNDSGSAGYVPYDNYEVRNSSDFGLYRRYLYEPDNGWEFHLVIGDTAWRIAHEDRAFFKLTGINVMNLKILPTSITVATEEISTSEVVDLGVLELILLDPKFVSSTHECLSSEEAEALGFSGPGCYDVSEVEWARNPGYGDANPGGSENAQGGLYRVWISQDQSYHLGLICDNVYREISDPETFEQKTGQSVADLPDLPQVNTSGANVTFQEAWDMNCLETALGEEYVSAEVAALREQQQQADAAEQAAELEAIEYYFDHLEIYQGKADSQGEYVYSSVESIPSVSGVMARFSVLFTSVRKPFSARITLRDPAGEVRHSSREDIPVSSEDYSWDVTIAADELYPYYGTWNFTVYMNDGFVSSKSFTLLAEEETNESEEENNISAAESSGRSSSANSLINSDNTEAELEDPDQSAVSTSSGTSSSSSTEGSGPDEKENCFIDVCSF